MKYRDNSGFTSLFFNPFSANESSFVSGFDGAVHMTGYFLVGVLSMVLLNSWLIYNSGPLIGDVIHFSARF